MLEEGNENVSAGFINERSSEWLVTGLGRMRTLQDIGETVVTATNGIPTKVADLGEVAIGEAPKRGDGSTQGQARRDSRHPEAARRQHPQADQGAGRRARRHCREAARRHED